MLRSLVGSEMCIRDRYQQAKATVRNLVGHQLDQGTDLVDLDGQLRPCSIPAAALKCPPHEPLAPPSPPAHAYEHFKSRRTQDVPRIRRASWSSTTPTSPPAPAPMGGVNAGRLGVLQLWAAIDHLKEDMHSEDEVADMVLSELARQCYVHCAERGLLLDHIRAQIKIQNAALRRSLEDAVVDERAAHSCLEVEKRRVNELTLEIKRQEQERRERESASVGSQTPAAWQYNDGFIDATEKLHLVEEEVISKQRQLDKICQAVIDQNALMTIKGRYVNFGVQTEIDSESEIAAKEKLEGLQAELELQRETADALTITMAANEQLYKESQDRCAALKKKNLSMLGKSVIDDRTMARKNSMSEMKYIQAMKLVETLQKRNSELENLLKAKTQQVRGLKDQAKDRDGELMELRNGEGAVPKRRASVLERRGSQVAPRERRSSLKEQSSPTPRERRNSKTSEGSDKKADKKAEGKTELLHRIRKLEADLHERKERAKLDALNFKDQVADLENQNNQLRQQIGSLPPSPETRFWEARKSELHAMQADNFELQAVPRPNGIPTSRPKSGPEIFDMDPQHGENVTGLIKLQALARGRRARKNLARSTIPHNPALALHPRGFGSPVERARLVKMQALARGRLARRQSALDREASYQSVAHVKLDLNGAAQMDHVRYIQGLIRGHDARSGTKRDQQAVVRMQAIARGKNTRLRVGRVSSRVARK
eukprot:TRINITY_DN19067_c0_g1_i2.p1 TRINITY_DN19067_c0_g1~~TRINITY_DN19067_c0_g1_i2.p1  ORF type:complete len:714 (+),score=213.12 TRINITY_DN19067_c0_g1_i2:151-2292(+)